MKKFSALLLTLVLLLSLSACQKQSRSLTEEEIQQVNDAFFFITAEGEMNPLTCMVMDCYETPAEMPLGNFLSYFPADGDVTDAAEFEALKGLETFPFQSVASLDQMPVPIHRISTASIDEFLTANMGIALADLTNTANTIYLAETDSYYTTTSDAGGAFFDCISGELNGDMVTLQGNSPVGSSVLTLKRSGEVWLVQSHLLNA